MKNPKKPKQQVTQPMSHLAAPTKRAMQLTDFHEDSTDPMGSYTGRPADPYETPVQDADDL